MTHRFALVNGDILETRLAVLPLAHRGLLSGLGCSTTVRVKHDVILYFERHWSRMASDAHRFGFAFPSQADTLRRQLLALISANRASESLLRLSVVHQPSPDIFASVSSTNFDVLALTADLPSYVDPIKLDLTANGRHASSEFAGASLTGRASDRVILETAQLGGFDDVLLLNERGEVSECTSLNVFIVRGHVVSTPPLNSGCRPGIVRDVILNELNLKGFKFVEEILHPGDLEDADEIFATSSSRFVVPVSSVKGLTLKSAECVVTAAVQSAFQQHQSSYISSQAAGD